MKTLLFGVVMMSAVASLAEGDPSAASSNVIGLLRVDSTAAETVIAAPWLAEGGGDIRVANLIKTENLTEGDELYYYNGISYDGWHLAKDANNVLVWKPYTIVDGKGTKATAGSDVATLPVGGTIILKRQNPAAGPFYLFGQVPESTSVASTAAAGCWTLMAPPMAESVTVGEATWTNCNVGDTLTFMKANGLIVVLKWDGAKWDGRGVATPVPSASGLWYNNVGPNAVTVTWPAASAGGDAK